MQAHFHWSSRSTSGTRKCENDDSSLIFAAGNKGCRNLDAQGRFTLDTEDIVFGVSDGMGGGNAGYLASALILEGLSKRIPQTFKAAAQGIHPDYLERLETQIREVHDSINRKEASDPQFKGMGATLTLAWFTPENLYIGHIGDSRLYLHRDGETQQLTHDHTFAYNKLKRGELNERQFRTHPRKSALYECIGAGHRNINPEVSAIPYQSGDRILICSDGIIDGLWDKHIHKNFTNNLSPEKAVEALSTRAIDNAGTDDTTLIYLTIE